MRHPVLLLLCSLMLMLHSQRVCAADAGDVFVSAYMAVQEGEKAEQAGRTKDAEAKYRYAAKLLEQISSKWPSWQPPIVEYRKKRTAEAVARVQKLTGVAQAPPVESVVPGLDPIPSAPPASSDLALPNDLLPGTSTPPAPREPRRDRNAKVEEPELPSSNPLKAIEDRMNKLQKDLEKARSEAELAQKEKADLARELKKATEARQAADQRREILEQRSAAAEAALLQAKADGKSDTEQTKKLWTDFAEVKKQLRDLKFEADAEAEFRQQLEDRVRASRQRIVRLSQEKAAAELANVETPTRIAEIQKQLDVATREKNEVVLKLAKTETDLKSALAQRDEALGQVARMKEAQKQVDKLIADNTSLMAKLSAAEKTISDVRADGVKKDEEMASLRKETVSLKEQLTAAQKDSVDYQKQMADLQQKLTQTNTQITQMKTDGAKSLAERSRLQDENLMLRGIVLRQQKEEARRAQTKKLVLSELGKLENKSKVLLDQVEYLSSPVVKLNEKERALFKKPELQISDTEISISAPRTDETLPVADPGPLPAADIASAPAATPEPPTPPPANVADVKPTVAPEVKTPTARDSKADSVAATPAPKIADVKPTPTPKAADPAKPAEPPKTTAKASTPPSTPPPALSIETGVKNPMQLASNRTSASPFSNLPDDLAGSLPEKKDPTPEPEKTPGASKPASTPEATPEKATEPAPTGSEPPLAAAPDGTGNVSSVVRNLPPDLVTQAREGKDHFERGNYREAEKVYERILAKAPNNLYTLSNLGVVYFRSGKLKRAEEMFKKSIAMAPEDGFSHCTLGIVYYSQQKYDEAVNELTKALAINPKNATAHNYLGITASQKGWQAAAQKELETAVTLDPTYADAHFNLAVVFATQQPPNKEQARKFYKRATELGAEPDTALEQLIK